MGVCQKLDALAEVRGAYQPVCVDLDAPKVGGSGCEYAMWALASPSYPHCSGVWRPKGRDEDEKQRCDALIPGYIYPRFAIWGGRLLHFAPAFGLLFRGGAALYTLLPSLHLTDRKFGCVCV